MMCDQCMWSKYSTRCGHSSYSSVSMKFTYSMILRKNYICKYVLVLSPVQTAFLAYIKRVLIVTQEWGENMLGSRLGVIRVLLVHKISMLQI